MRLEYLPPEPTLLEVYDQPRIKGLITMIMRQQRLRLTREQDGHLTSEQACLFYDLCLALRINPVAVLDEHATQFINIDRGSAPQLPSPLAPQGEEVV